MEIDGWYRSTLERGCQQRVDRVSAKYRPGIDRHVDTESIEVSIATIDRHPIAGVISTHDPKDLHSIEMYSTWFGDDVIRFAAGRPNWCRNFGRRSTHETGLKSALGG